jgi:uncharacterized protein (DUF2461 family)
MFRVYRDTRFSEDKTPLKTHVAWSLWPRGFPGLAAGPTRSSIRLRRGSAAVYHP